MQQHIFHDVVHASPIYLLFLLASEICKYFCYCITIAALVQCLKTTQFKLILADPGICEKPILPKS